MKIFLKVSNPQAIKWKLKNRLKSFEVKEISENIYILKNKIASCFIKFEGNRLTVVSGFSSIYSNFLAFLFLIIGGIFIPVLLYYAFFYKRHKFIELKVFRSIHSFLKEDMILMN